MIQFLYDMYFRYWKKWGWFGDYPDWQAAQNDCIGYDSNEITEKVKSAALKVKNGEAAFERDSVLFYKLEYDQNLLRALEKVNEYLQKQGEKEANLDTSLRVIDFGGSLGSTYFQHQKALEKFPNLIWCVVEQKHFVDIGKQSFQTDRLFFEYTLQTAFDRFKPNFFLLNSVLQYIEHPYELIKAVENLKIPFILMQRTPMIEDRKDRITQQIAHPSVYKASYPSWVFGEWSFKATLQKTMTIEWEKAIKYDRHHVAGKQLLLKDLFISNTD